MKYVKRQALSAFVVLAIAAGCLLGVSQSRAQVPTEKKPLAFEVASVRQSDGNRNGGGLPRPMPGGQGFVVTNSDLMIMFMSAYRITDSQVVGAPDWMFLNPRWDVEAKAERPSTPEQLREMFQNLLADRFNLRFHRETKEMAAYVLSVDSDTDTVPSPAYLAGNCGAISPNGTCSLCQALGIQTTALGVPNIQKDALGNPLFANEIYDPATRGTVNGLGYATPFPNNVIPASRFDPVSVNLIKLFQKLGAVSQNQNLLSNNYMGTIPGGRYSAIPAVKIDHNIDAKDKLSFYYSENNTQSQISGPLGNQDGLPTEIGQYRGTFVPTYTERLNYDRTLAPTLLLHLGAGYLHTSFSDRAPFLNFDPAQFGLSGFLNDRQFPSITELCIPISFANPACNSLGGMQTIGTSGQIQSQNFEEKPSMNANMTWVHGKHTYKAGAELYFEQDYTGSFSGVTLATGIGPTSQPFQPTNSLNGYTTGFGFASFLLGDYSATTQTPQENTREGSAELGVFVHDSWKVTRKLTVDYGIRWDLSTPEHEQYGRLGQLDETLANANAGGHPGALQYANTCNCSFYPGSYPYAFGPRLGVAYKIDTKTVLRAGWGVTYQFVANPAGAVYGTQGIFALAPQPNNAQFVNDQTPGFIVKPTFPVTNPNLFPVAPGTLGAPGSFFQAATEPYVPDPQQNRPPRVNQ